MVNETYLMHHQIKGAKWGQRNGPPYPLSKDISTGKRLKARGAALAKRKAAVAKKAQVKATKASEKQKKNEEQKQAQNEKTKNKILKSRSIAKVYKHADLFSDQELEKIKNRFTLENDIKKLRDSAFIQKGRSYVDKIGMTADGLDRIASTIEKGSKTYNNVAKVMNSLYGSDMKIIGEVKNTEKRTTEYTKTTRTKDKSGNDVTIVKKWKE